LCGVGVRFSSGSIHVHPTGHSLEYVEKLTFAAFSIRTASAGTGGVDLGAGVALFATGWGPQEHIRAMVPSIKVISVVLMPGVSI
jgi:hypothetical protein